MFFAKYSNTLKKQKSSKSIKSEKKIIQKLKQALFSNFHKLFKANELYITRLYQTHHSTFLSNYIQTSRTVIVLVSS